MSRLYLSLYLALAIIGLSSIFVYTTVKAQDESSDTTVVEQHIIVSPAPAAKEIVVTPTGFVNCFTITGGWYHNEWIPEHKVCQYENMAEGVAWVEGYWACNKSTTSGVCTNWEWKPGHWEKTLDVY